MRSKRGWFAFPYVIWMALFVVVPIIIMAVYAFTAADPATGAAQATLGNFTGMGLYLCRKLAGFLELGLDISSREGEGTAVTLTFPAKENLTKL